MSHNYNNVYIIFVILLLNILIVGTIADKPVNEVT